MSYFSIVVPLIPQHDSKIKVLFEGLAKENDFIKEIILCRSESLAPNWLLRMKFNYIAKISGVRAVVIIESIRGVARDGTNRNRGWAVSTAPYVAFLDADDLYAESRLQTLYEVFKLLNPDAIIHNYENLNVTLKSDNTIVIDHAKLKNCQLSKTKLELEEFYNICDEEGLHLQIHFAHLTVKTSLRNSVKFSDRFPGADTQMTQDLILHGCKVVYIDSKLSSWSRDRSVRYKLRLVRSRIKTLFRN